MIRVKICGIKKTKDALAAVRYGADALGFLVGQKSASDDFISPEKAQSIVAQLPPFCSSVLVTHLTNVDRIAELARTIGVTTIQLHGESAPDDAEKIHKILPYIKLYKAIHVTGDESVKDALAFKDIADAALLDTVDVAANKVGGTGKIHNWEISKKIVERYPGPVILAGGLNPDNVEEAIRQVRPFGVDVNSGTKADDGFKDHKKLKAFIEKAKSIKTTKNS